MAWTRRWGQCRQAPNRKSRSPPGRPAVARYGHAMIPGLILAAGQSSRMGRPKAGLPVADGGPTFAAAIVATLRAAGIGEIVIVAGAHPVAVAESVLGLPAVRVVQIGRASL